MPLPKVTIYTDGGADPNPGIGGWAAILRSGDHEKILTGNDPQTTNNAMELTAAISALQALKTACDVTLYTDSEYLRLGVMERTARLKQQRSECSTGPIPNKELWQELMKLVQIHQDIADRCPRRQFGHVLMRHIIVTTGSCQASRAAGILEEPIVRFLLQLQY